MRSRQKRTGGGSPAGSSGRAELGRQLQGGVGPWLSWGMLTSSLLEAPSLEVDAAPTGRLSKFLGVLSDQAAF